jgi:hypothetical protein
MSLVSKIYIWSIMFEPLLFFVFSGNDNIFNIPFSFSRVLHVLVIFLLIISFFLKVYDNKKIVLVNNFFPENKYLFLFFALAIISGLLGIINQSYSTTLLTNVDQKLFTIFNPYFKRSLFEYIILLFNIFYFVILPRNLINTKIEFDYLFKLFKFFLAVSLLFGYADYLISKFSSIDLIGRHFRDNIDVGSRFHGLGGEPRQASAQMMFYIGMYIIYCNYFKVQIKKSVISLLVVGLILTSSMSLFIGLVFFIFFLFSFRLISIKNILYLSIIMLIIFSFDRVKLYVDALTQAWFYIENQEKFPHSLNVIRGEVFPVYDLIKKIQNFDLVPVFFGSGLGSVSAINNAYIGEYIGIANPNSQFIRMLYEHGLLGFLVFIISMTWPIKYINTDKRNENLYIFSMLIVLSISLAVRSPVIYIFLGILTSFLHFNEKNLKIKIYKK